MGWVWRWVCGWWVAAPLSGVEREGGGGSSVPNPLPLLPATALTRHAGRLLGQDSRQQACQRPPAAGLAAAAATGLTPAALAAPARRHAGDQVVQQGPQRIQVGGAGGWGALQ